MHIPNHMGLISLKTTVIDLRRGMPEEIRDAWHRLRQTNPNLESPYFSPEFTNIVAAAGRPVELAVLKHDENIVGLFPFERRRWSLAGPVGSLISDYHGIICRPDFKFDPCQILRSCGLVAWDFNHAIQTQMVFKPFYKKENRSPIIDLTDGYNEYIKKRSASGTEIIKKIHNLERRLIRELGPLRFIVNSSDKKLLNTVIKLKTEQFQRNQWRDIFSLSWVNKSIVGIHETHSESFSGMLSALYAGDKLISAHFGMRSKTIWHYWFPAFERSYAKYSPGVMLLLKMAEAAPEMGINIIDLGCGEHSYKWRLMNGFIPTASGSVELSGPITFARKVLRPVENMPLKARHLIGKTPIGEWARRIGSFVK